MEKLLSVTAPLAFSIFSFGSYKDSANYESINFFKTIDKKNVFFLFERENYKT